MLVRIIGIGSWCGDDRIGWEAVDAIHASGLLLRFPANSVEACRCDRPGDILALAGTASALILVDAMRSGAPAGTVRRLAADEPLPREWQTSTHGLGVAEYLAIGHALGTLPPVLLLYGIEAPAAAPASEPDDKVLSAIPALLRLLAADLAELLEGKQGRP